jgi:F0F1-type ATP synthase assembly protein I
MSTNLQTGSEPSLASLATGIINDVQELFKQQLDLLKHEFQASLRASVEASACLLIGLAMMLVGGAVLGFGLVYLLAWLFPTLPLFACYLIVAGALVIPGAGLAYIGAQNFKTVEKAAEEAGETIKENLEWTTKQR